MPVGVVVDPPHSLKPADECALDEVDDIASIKSMYLSAAFPSLFFDNEVYFLLTINKLLLL